MKLTKNAIAVVAFALFIGVQPSEARTIRTRSGTTYTSSTPYTVPGTNLRVNRAPYQIYHLGGTTVYQFNRRSTSFTWPNAYTSTYGYGNYYTYPYSYQANPYFGYP